MAIATRSRTEAGIDEARRIVVARRIAQIERGEVQLVPGDEVFARLRRKLGGQPDAPAHVYSFPNIDPARPLPATVGVATLAIQ